MRALGARGKVELERALDLARVARRELRLVDRDVAFQNEHVGLAALAHDEVEALGRTEFSVANMCMS